MAKNCYRNLEMLLDNGYTMDYATLSAYCNEYLGKKNGQPDAFYNVLTGCLGNPYLLNRPAATVRPLSLKISTEVTIVCFPKWSTSALAMSILSISVVALIWLSLPSIVVDICSLE